MTATQLRQVKFWDPDVQWEQRDDGSWIIWQTGELSGVPERLSDKIQYWAERSPDKTWMAERNSAGDWARTSYAEMLGSIRSIGQALLDIGLSVDRPLVILSANSVAHGLMALAAQYVGIPSAAIAPAYSLVSSGYDKLISVRDQITPGAVFADEVTPFQPAIDAVFTDLPVLGVTGGGLHTQWDDLISTVVTSAVDAANAATGPDTVAKFLFTSGTTGSPKAVIHTQRMMCANMEQVTDCYAFLRDSPPVILDWAPWNHVAAGNLVFNVAIYNGGTFYIDDGRPTKDLIGRTIRNLREVGSNFYFNVPFGYEMLVDAMEADPELAKVFFGPMQLTYYAGAAMARHTWDALERLAVEATGERVQLATGLGTTETAPFAMFNTNPDAPAGCLGVPAKAIKMKLVPAESKWEVRMKGPNITPGYWRNEKLTHEAFDEEGYYCLGDALRFVDAQDPSKGFLFDGRVAENFKLSTGTWVSVGALRAKLTDVLQGLIRDAVIVGEGHDSLGALLVPFRPNIEKIIPDGATMDDATLFSHPLLHEKLADLLGQYNATATGSSLRIPRAMVLTTPLDMNKGEVTDKGSVNQRAVRNHRAELVDQLYASGADVIQGKRV